MEPTRGYWAGYWVTWVLLFIGFWIYAISEYGFLLGVGLGWLPSIIAASILSFFWPLLALGIAIIGIVMLSRL